MNLKEITYWCLIVGIVALGIYLLFYMKTESYQCLSNPYNYSIALLEKANDAEISCICTGNRQGVATFVWNNQGFSAFKSDLMGSSTFTPTPPPFNNSGWGTS